MQWTMKEEGLAANSKATGEPRQMGRFRLRLHRMTLFQRLLLVGIAMTFIVVGLAAYIGLQVSGSLEQRIVKDRLSSAQAAAAGLDAMVHHYLLDLRVMGANVSRVDWSALSPGQADRLLSDLVDRGLHESDLDTVILSAPTGEVIAREHGVTSTISSYAVDFLPTAVSGASAQDPFFSPPFSSPEDPSAHIAITVPLVHKNGQTLGYLTGILDMGRSPLPAYLASISGVLQTGHADLLGSDGRVIASTDDDHVLTLGDHPGFYAAERNAHDAIIKTVPYEEDEEGPLAEDHVMAYVSLKSAPWALAVGSSVSDTYAPVRAFNKRMLWLVGFVLGFTIIGGVIGTARLVHPVRVLSLSAGRMAGGDLSQPIVVKEGGEIGDLAKDLDSMRIALNHSLEEIQELNRGLEQRIAERTRQLEHRNRDLEAASAIAGKVSSATELNAVLHQTLESVAEVTGERSIAIFLMDGEGKRLTLTAGLDLNTPFASQETSVAVGQCLCGQVALSGKADLVEDLENSPRMLRTACGLAGYRCVVSFPLQSRDRIEGVLTVFSPKASSITPADYPIVTLICHQIGVAIQNARLYQEAREKEKLAHQLLEKVINAQEEERKRLARELHDETGQTLTAIAMSLESLGGQLGPERADVIQQLDSLHQMSLDALGELRKMAMALRPSALDDLGLLPAVRRYALQHLQPQGIQVTIEGQEIDTSLTSATQTLLFRIVQEAINNVARHSKATTATIRFWQERDYVCGEVLDNGIGFDPRTKAAPGSPSGGLGLQGMQERAALVGGVVDITSTPEEGTRVLVRVPSKKGVLAQ